MVVFIRVGRIVTGRGFRIVEIFVLRVIVEMETLFVYLIFVLLYFVRILCRVGVVRSV